MNVLISVFDKSHIDYLAKELNSRGFRIISTTGTYRYLKERGIIATKIEDLTGFPEMLDGRVKSMHPTILGGILARSNQLQELQARKIDPIDMVVCNLYPFESVSNDEKLVENVDIGGVTLIRAAAKNFERVTVIVDPVDYDTVIKALSKDGEISKKLRIKLALKAFSYIAKYDVIIYNRFWSVYREVTPPDRLFLMADKYQPLRYGENPHQNAAYYLNTTPWFEQLHGKELSYNNIVDMDAAVDTVFEFSKPAVTIIKHTVPCGVAIADTIKDAYLKALEGDRVSAYGSIVCANKKIDLSLAKELKKLFIELIIAPDFEPEALQFLKKVKKNTRIIKVNHLPHRTRQIKDVYGGYLVQDYDVKALDKFNIVTVRAPTSAQLQDLIFAWKIVKHAKSNAIVLARDNSVVGVGAGQPSRIDAVKIAIMKAGTKAKGAVLASDAFFPFRDNIDEAAKAGILAIIQPGGSIRDKEVITAANEHGISMIFTGYRVFRH